MNLRPRPRETFTDNVEELQGPKTEIPGTQSRERRREEEEKHEEDRDTVT